MRQRRQRIFRVVINGSHSWSEDAANRSLVEFQHRLATNTFKGSFVRVTEQYLGGARAKIVEEEAPEE